MFPCEEYSYKILASNLALSLSNVISASALRLSKINKFSLPLFLENKAKGIPLESEKLISN